MNVDCRLFETEDETAWEEYVVSHPQGTFFHRAAWQRVIVRSFGHKPYYSLTLRAGKITGILPLIHMKTRLFGNALVSTPFCVSGGPIADDPESLQALTSMADKIMVTLRVPVCELRGGTDLGADWQTSKGLYAGFRRMLPDNNEETLKAIPRKQRAVVRKAIQNGLTSVTSTSLEPFFHLYAESLRDHGTPMFPRRYFLALVENFCNSVEILTVYNKQMPICAVLCFYHKNEVLPYYAGGSKISRNLGGHDFMYWEVMRRAVDRGLTSFDFGRSKIDTGPYTFKRNWGFEPEPISYSWRLHSGGQIYEHNPLNPKYRLMIAAWKRLPLMVANFVGPYLLRGLG
jgi:FemAB-related protein (PEP-CTERM system-associated)